MATILLVALLAFWGQLATGAAACFSNLAPPPPKEGTIAPEPPKPSHKQIRIKRVKTPPDERAPHAP